MFCFSFFFFLSNSKKELHAGNTFSIERKKKGVFLFFFSCNDISKGKRRSFEVTASLLPLPLPLYLCISKFLRNNAEAGRHYPPRFLHHSGWDSCLVLSCWCFFFFFFIPQFQISRAFFFFCVCVRVYFICPPFFFFLCAWCVDQRRS